MAVKNGRPSGGTSRGPGRVARRPEPAAEREVHQASGTAVAAEALRTGVLPNGHRRREAIPHEDDRIRVGDPDDDALANEYVGEDVPGGSTPAPDQNEVDQIVNGINIYTKLGIKLREESIDDCAETLRKYAVGYIQGDKPICRPKLDESAVMFLVDDVYDWTHLRKHEFERIFKC